MFTGGIRVPGDGMTFDHCSFCGKSETETGLMVRGREAATCPVCLRTSAHVADNLALWLAKKCMQQRLATRARWRVVHRWKARGLPAFDV